MILMVCGPDPKSPESNIITIVQSKGGVQWGQRKEKR
jgi:hypothetical protein